MSKDHFKGKRVAVVGLGPHGEMLSDVKYLIKAGALVGIYDLRSEARIKNHLVFLRTIGLANYVCGSIPADDLIDMDMIVLSHDYPRDSTFLRPARDNGVRIEYPETLFLKLSPPVTVVGIIGECGKTSVMSMLAPMLAHASEVAEHNLFEIDPESEDGILSNLKKIHNGDLVLIRIEDPMLSELAAIRISPQVAVFTSIPGRSRYDSAQFEVLAYQTHNNFIVAPDEVIDKARSLGELPRAKMLRTKASMIPADWECLAWRAHERLNAALAIEVARIFKVDDEFIRHTLLHWKPGKHRLEFIKKVKNVEFYDDAASERSSSTVAALTALDGERNTVLIFGGAHSDNEHGRLYEILPKYVHTVVLLPGSGTLRERKALSALVGIEIISAPSIEEATRMAFEQAKKGDKVLFSPGFEAGGIERSRKERGERFVRAVRTLS